MSRRRRSSAATRASGSCGSTRGGLDAAGVTLEEVFEAARRGTQMTGGGYLETPSQRIVLQAQAPAASVAALGQTLVTTRGGVPVRLDDVAQIRDGAGPRFGDAIIGGRPGILVETSTQYGANTLDVTRDLEHRLEVLAPALAQHDVQYHPALLRPASFIESAIAKLRNSLLIGAVLVVVLLLVTLRDWRGAFISFSAIPVSLLATVWILSAWGLSLNTDEPGRTGGGARRRGRRCRHRRGEHHAPAAPPPAARRHGMRTLLLQASLEVRRPVFYATAAVAVAFLPIVMLSGLQGAFFRPLATAFLLAVGLSLLVAMSVTPAMCALLMQDYAPRPEPDWLRRCKSWQRALITRLARARAAGAGAGARQRAPGLALLPLLGARLLPDFRENYLIAHAALRPGISLAETARVGQRIAGRLAAIPGVKSVAEQIGRAENGQDPDAPNKSEFEIQLDPQAVGEHRAAGSRRCARSSTPFPTNWWRFIRSWPSVSARRLGRGGPVLRERLRRRTSTRTTRSPARSRRSCASGRRAARCALQVPPRQPELQVHVREEQLALFGLQAADVLGDAQRGTITARWSRSSTSADRSVPVVARIAAAGATPADIGALPLRGRDGARVPLAQVATLRWSPRAASSIPRGRPATPGGGRQPAHHQPGRLCAARRSEAIAAHVRLPPNVYLRFRGSAPAQRRRRVNCCWHSGAALILIVLLLALAFGHSRHVLLVLAALPSTLIGGVIAVALTGGTLSLGAMVGFVALFGIAGAQHHPAHLALRASGHGRTSGLGPRRRAARRGGSV